MQRKTLVRVSYWSFALKGLFISLCFAAGQYWLGMAQEFAAQYPWYTGIPALVVVWATLFVPSALFCAAVVNKAVRMQNSHPQD